LKLPVLFEHYLEHKTKNSELSFFDFMALHYNQEFDHDKNDHKLPFKGHETCVSSIFIATIAPVFVLSITKPDYYDEKQIITFRNNHFHSSVISSIWQPPRA
jgi:hypothetical protein